MIGLPAEHIHALRPAVFDQAEVDLSQGHAPVDLRFALAEQVQIGTV